MANNYHLLVLHCCDRSGCHLSRVCARTYASYTRIGGIASDSNRLRAVYAQICAHAIDYVQNQFELKSSITLKLELARHVPMSLRTSEYLRTVSLAQSLGSVMSHAYISDPVQSAYEQMILVLLCRTVCATLLYKAQICIQFCVHTPYIYVSTPLETT